MAQDFVPTTDAGLLAFATPYSAQITATPTAFGLLAANATQLASLLSSYSSTLAAAKDPTTRGPANVLAKDEARKNLVAYIRETARQIQGTITVTDLQRQGLGLPIRSTTHTPVPAPDAAPDIDIVSVSGRTVRLRLHGAGSTRRAKPAGCQSANIFSFVGATPPTDPALWRFEGGTSKVLFDVAFPTSVAAGAQVWFAACWLNAKCESGPGCDAVGTTLAGGSTTAMHMTLAQAA